MPSSVYEEHENGITVEQAVADIVAPFSNDRVNVETGAYLFRMTDYVLESNGMEVNEESRSYKALAREGLEKVQNEFRGLIEQHANYKLEYEIKNKEWFGDLLGESVVAPQPQQMVTVEDTGELLSVVHEKYMDESQRSVSGRTLEKKRKSFAVWIELHGDRGIQGFSKEHGRKFKETLMKIPKNAGVKYRGKSLEELLALEVDVSERLHAKTINYHLCSINNLIHSSVIDICLSDEQMQEMKETIKSRAGKNVGRAINFSRTSLSRTFNKESFEKGGRFYRGWWQGIPSKYRRYININGQPTVEIDYKSLSVSLAYAEVGLEKPDGEGYGVLIYFE